MNTSVIPFNKPFITGRELSYIAEAHMLQQLAGDGAFTKKCHKWLEGQTGCAKALLTNSCTAALEMAAILADIKPGDEVIMPSFTFVSTANAFVLRGGVPVFVDIRKDTLNIDESLIEAAITPKTKAIAPVHYAGVGAEMGKIMEIAAKHKLVVIEDAAQGIMSNHAGKPLGTFGQLGTLSFHETKNIIAGEGGALLINDPELAERAEIIREKGTNRSQFSRGIVDKYRWVDMGSSFLPGEITAAFLLAQLQEADKITKTRKQLWDHYHELLQPLEQSGFLRRPIIPANCEHNAHLYYVLLKDGKTRNALIDHLKQQGIYAVFHYVPLHSAPAGEEYGRAHGSMDNTDKLSASLMRLPLWIGLDDQLQQRVVDAIYAFSKQG